ncbi:ATP-dependent Clp protease adaptor ClpS [Ideonella azotifigens]|uniref:ATP-dependent Clp protease adaptor ClpS n=1 Tax=Ideonella azotifigens TaxID=513160 RepID=UPI001B85DF4F|nr:ATP-dependent Clp protease adaptor ClpS [Ideonella azotifigens]MCD2344090.1 ATP-dependent Clp protease adaptor ClpS [Ideonella azotifigens]
MKISVILVLIGLCLLAGGVLYLPFFLWFRYRRRDGREVAAQLRFTHLGYGLIALQVVLQFAGLAAGILAPESRLGSQTQGFAGFLRWSVCIIVIFCIVNALLQRFGVALDQPRAAEDSPTAALQADLQAQRGRLKVATLRGVPVFVHWSFPAGGLLISCVANPGVLGAVFYCLAYAALIAIHEFGHFLAARAFGLKVFAVDISGLGGACLVQAPRSLVPAFWIYGAGALAQAGLLALTLAAVALHGAPQSVGGRSVVITFTFVNGLLLLMNLIPGKTRGGLSTDGEVLWGLYLHATRGHAHPLAQQLAASPVFPPSARLLAMEKLVPPGFTTGIELLNDDTTPMEFVVEMLEKHAKLEREAAIALMLGIHTQGGMLLPLANFDQAERVALAIQKDALANRHQLVCRAVESRSQ